MSNIEDYKPLARADERWALAGGEYKIAIGLFRRDGERIARVMQTEADIQITSHREARYYFGQFTDLKRRVRKLERAVNRLF